MTFLGSINCAKTKPNRRKVFMLNHTIEFAATQPQTAVVFAVGSLYDYFQRLTDKRKPRGLRYPLAVVLAMTLLAKLAGEDEPAGIAHWVALRKAFLLEALALNRQTTPHAVTFSRVLGEAIEVEEFERSLQEFFSCALHRQPLTALALDGKVLRGTIPCGQTQGLHLLALYLPQQGVVLMQVEVEAHENELSAAPKVLKSLDLQGKIITGDAIFAQPGLCQLVLKQGGEYLWKVKDNQASLREEIQTVFDIEQGKTALKVMNNDVQVATSVEKGHGRIEERRLLVSSVLRGHGRWPGLEQVFQVERQVYEVRSQKSYSETHYGMTSLSGEQANAAELLSLVRNHWGIENGLHYRRDRTLKEDACRLRVGQAARVMAILNNVVIGLVRQAGLTNLPEARRTYNANPQVAVNLLLRSSA
jgi:predicted transposase YbfD/YdcC